MGIMGKNAHTILPSEVLSQFNSTIGIFTQERILNECYSDCVNLFCLYDTSVRPNSTYKCDVLIS